MYGGHKKCAAAHAQVSFMEAPTCIFWENELLHFHAYSLIKYTYYQLGYTEIGTQTLQKRKSWEVRTWELVGTEFPRWGAIAHFSLDPLIYECVQYKNANLGIYVPKASHALFIQFLRLRVRRSSMKV